MTTIVAPVPPASATNRLRMIRSRTLSSAPPMTMTDPSPMDRPSIAVGRGRPAGGQHGATGLPDRLDRAGPAGPRFGDGPQEEGPDGEEHDRQGERQAGTLSVSEEGVGPVHEDPPGHDRDDPGSGSRDIADPHIAARGGLRNDVRHEGPVDG